MVCCLDRYADVGLERSAVFGGCCFVMQNVIGFAEASYTDASILLSCSFVWPSRSMLPASYLNSPRLVSVGSVPVLCCRRRIEAKDVVSFELWRRAKFERTPKDTLADVSFDGHFLRSRNDAANTTRILFTRYRCYLDF